MNWWKHITFLSISLLVSGALLVSPLNSSYAQSESSTSLTIRVFDDLNASATYDLDENLLTGWQAVLLDAQHSELDRYELSSQTNSFTINIDPYMVCIVPQADWLLTYPSTDERYPQSNWDCHLFSVEQEQYSFGVMDIAGEQLEGEVEAIGQIIPPADNETSKDTILPESVDTGAVLGATTGEPEVLAATGELVTLLPLAGVVIALVALIIRQDSRRYKRY